ncbi:NAD(P)/FAD-dependent oxidoreductase [Pseudomonas vancouverensis]|uniref:FAD-binding oxidoreductase n=1 Tax=Pseudomonas vancouverensis TaxID=95300 RepID=A0A1H2NN42_PSEVA|nr:FAD-binding oxidoreductase [Pseudomonas vancouverensis]KAB0495348.1 FAD-binding oxidoreductase [Pseudomonas vancouverensis]TDB62421.1 FAD-binding oxidoreductase [Pseudomonas vancouverensis]SDV06917.1 taurine dehydrogenase large subunit [Pseudomonas vancouverensis]
MYDPLVNAHPGVGAAHTPSYWVGTAGSAPQDDGPVSGAMDVDVAIIGAGYTGLSCALHLAREHGIRAVVLEANQVAWGCSGRNGSFARISGGRVALAELISRYGATTAKAYFEEMSAGLNTVRGLIRDGQIECDAQPDGVYKVASQAKHVEGLKREAGLYNDVLKYNARFVTGAQVQAVHNGAESFGALFMPDGFSMHPLKLAWGIHRMAREAGVKVHVASPVVDWHSDNSSHRLVTPGGVVTARRVVVATNGYTSGTLNKATAGRVLPVHSQIIVTRPLSAEEKRQSLPGSECMFDTRNLLSYYRRLPDDRILFGGRSAITGRDAENPRHRQNLHDALCRKFPVLQGIAVDYNWGGWVAVSENSLPFIYQVQGQSNVFSAGGYAGSGVSFSVQAGKRLAQMVAGEQRPTAVDFLHQPPKRFPFQSFLRVGQRMAYTWYRFKDAQ